MLRSVVFLSRIISNQGGISFGKIMADFSFISDYIYTRPPLLTKVSSKEHFQLWIFLRNWDMLEQLKMVRLVWNYRSQDPITLCLSLHFLNRLCKLCLCYSGAHNWKSLSMAILLGRSNCLWLLSFCLRLFWCFAFGW